jgi:SchA/CurD like domain
MQRYALAFTVKPGTEQQVAGILGSYGRPVTEIDENTRLLGTTVFMQGNLVVRVLDIEGELPTVMQHLAAQPEIQEAERQLTPYLQKERDMSSPEGARAFFISAMMQQLTHRTASV